VGLGAVIFDLDGVLTDTAEFHYQSWKTIADELRVPFDRAANEPLRGLSREESLARLLGPRADQFSSEQRVEIARRKNDEYLRRVEKMTPVDLAVGAAELLSELKRAGVPLAVASSSRNAHAVIDRLGIAALLDAIVDGNDAPRSKPDPQVFLQAAERLGVPPGECVVVEDASSGVAAAKAAGMRSVGIGPRGQVGEADHVFDALQELSLQMLLGAPARSQTRV